MARLGDRVQDALDETRMLILGAQVLLGFQFQAAMQPGFARLPSEVQRLKLVGLVVMLCAIGLLIAPAAYHQIVERGNDSTRVTGFATRIAALGLLPFAIGIAIDIYTATFTIAGTLLATVAAVLAAGFAVFFWYGLEFIVARHLHMAEKADLVVEHTRLEDKIKQVLTEARVVLPGA